MASIKANSGVKAIFRFHGGEWKVDPNTFDFLFGGPEGNASIVLTGAGLTLDAAAGQVRNMRTPVTGAGAFVKTGAGRVNFKAGKYLTWTGATSAVPTPSTISDPNLFTSCTTNSSADATTARYTGITRVLGGTLAFDAGTIKAGCATNFEVSAGAVLDFGGASVAEAAISGSGTVTNAAFASATLKLTAGNNWTIAGVTTFGSSTFAEATVDFGRTVSNPFPDLPVSEIVVARYAGEAPAGVESWSVSGMGLSNVNSRFTAANGEIRCRLFYPGSLIIFK